ncbi:MAG TPA: hypothetical protein PLS69_03155 [Terricaulis sp.]|nr:hypothetical protein [Terricaulis sp.]HRP10632.1 hypothetical protein [Terricaulis sp.]
MADLFFAASAAARGGETFVRFMGLTVSDNMFWTVLSIVVGAAISIYTSLVFNRYSRYSEIVRELARLIDHKEIRASSPRGLRLTHAKAIDFWRAVERIQWELEADGHKKASVLAARLRSFAYVNAASLEKLLNDQELSKLQSAEFSYYQQQFDKVWEDKALGKTAIDMRPSTRAAFSLLPHPVRPKRAVDASINAELLP